jgi:hypothetical protein
VNEIQIIQGQLTTEQQHFSEVAEGCSASLDKGHFTPGSDFLRACADYFAFASTRVPGVPAPPGPDAPLTRWREFLSVFKEAAVRHFAAIEQLRAGSLPVTEWRTRSGIDADSIFTERTRYARVKATVP